MNEVKARCGGLWPMLGRDGRLFLRRTLSIDSLRRQGVWPVCRVEEEQVCSFDQPELNWSDEVLRQCACRLPPLPYCG